MSIYEDLSRVRVVKALESEETIDTAKLHEPFRASMNSQQHILYRRICLCPTSLDVGFCVHVFFLNIMIKIMQATADIPQVRCHQNSIM